MVFIPMERQPLVAVVDTVVVVEVTECVVNVKSTPVCVATDRDSLLSSIAVIKAVVCNGVNCVVCSNEADVVGVVASIKVVSARVDSTTLIKYNIMTNNANIPHLKSTQQNQQCYRAISVMLL